MITEKEQANDRSKGNASIYQVDKNIKKYLYRNFCDAQKGERFEFPTRLFFWMPIQSAPLEPTEIKAISFRSKKVLII